MDCVLQSAVESIQMLSKVKNAKDGFRLVLVPVFWVCVLSVIFNVIFSDNPITTVYT